MRKGRREQEKERKRNECERERERERIVGKEKDGIPSDLSRSVGEKFRIQQIRL